MYFSIRIENNSFGVSLTFFVVIIYVSIFVKFHKFSCTHLKCFFATKIRFSVENAHLNHQGAYKMLHKEFLVSIFLIIMICKLRQAFFTGYGVIHVFYVFLNDCKQGRKVIGTAQPVFYRRQGFIWISAHFVCGVRQSEWAFVAAMAFKVKFKVLKRGVAKVANGFVAFVAIHPTSGIFQKPAVFNCFG